MTEATRPGRPEREPRASLSLLHYRRRVADLYAAIRELEPIDGHDLWRRTRDELFASHEQSPIPPQRRGAFRGLPVWGYDPSLRFELAVRPAPGSRAIELPHSREHSTTTARPVGSVEAPLPGGAASMTLYRLEQYGDSLFLPFADGTSGTETYAGGRYLIDTAKGADLGSTETTIVVDFNFAYHPSCVHDATWSCPLAPASNRIEQQIRAGERLP